MGYGNTGNSDFFAWQNSPEKRWQDQKDAAYRDAYNWGSGSNALSKQEAYHKTYDGTYADYVARQKAADDAYKAKLNPSNPTPSTPTNPKPSTPPDTTAADAAKKAAADAAAKKAAEDKAAADKLAADKAAAIKASNIQDYNKALGKAQEKGRLGQIDAQSQVAQMNKAATETNPMQMGEAGSQMDQSARQAVGGGGFDPVAAMRQQMGSSGGAGYGGPSQEKKVGAGAYAQAQETNKTGSGRNAFQLPNTSNITFGGV